MTKLEQTLSKKSLALLDTIRQQRGIRTRAKALETVLLEATQDEQKVMPWDEIVPTGTYGQFDDKKFADRATSFQKAMVQKISQIITAKSADFVWQKYLFVRGYRDWEIEKFEAQFKIRFPKMYREFLGVIGKPPKDQSSFQEHIFEGIISLHLVKLIKQDFTSDYQEFEGLLPPLDQKIIFYFSHQSTFYEYFVAGNDDPRVFHFNIHEGIIDLECTFSERILQKLDQSLRFAQGKIPDFKQSKSELYFV